MKRIPKRVRAHVLESPWAITEDSLRTILTIVDRQNADPEAVAAKLGRPLDYTHAVTVRDGVATIPVEGPLFRHGDLFTEISGATTYEQLATDLTSAADDPGIHAIVLAIDSPGGEVTGVSELAKLIRETSARKPVIAYVEGLGASAAYWLASAAGEVVASDTALLGSIGTRQTFVDTRDAMAAKGVKTYEIVSSQSPAKVADPATPDGRARIQQTLDSLTGVFVAEVARYRGVTPEAVIADFGQGGILVGAAAVEAGLADHLGTYESVLATLASRSPRAVAGRRTAQHPTQETHMPDPDNELTAAEIATAHPEWVRAWQLEGATAERERILAIDALPAAGHDALVAAARRDPACTAETLSRQILEAEAGQRTARLEALKTNEARIEAPVPAPRAADDPVTGRDAGRQIALRYRALTTTTART